MNITGKLDSPVPFGRYTLTAKIAMGGMATVYRGETQAGDPLHGRELAIKILHPHLEDNDEFIRMFGDEGRIARDFDHPNLVQVLDVGEANGQHYLAMELVDGRDLAQLLVAHRLNNQVMATPLAFEITRQCLNALRYVHGWRGRNGRLQGVVHRDISPQNILISRQPMIKVTDFGIARGEHRSDRTRTGTVKGKMHYMAPEQAAGARVDARADLYAMGAVAYEMLTGQPLFGPGTTEVLQARAVRGQIDYGAKFERLTDDVKVWLRKALATHPDDRFQSADAMLAALEQIPKAAQKHYKPEQLVRLLELPEASRRRQRELIAAEQRQALANSRGAILSSVSPSRPSMLAPKAHVELDSLERDSRLRKLSGVHDVNWSQTDDAPLRPDSTVRPARGALSPSAVSSSSVSAVSSLRKGRSDRLPAEQAVNKSYAVERKAAAVVLPAGSVEVLKPADPAVPPVADVVTPAPKPAAKKAAARPVDTPEQRGLVLASIMAWSCAALMLFAVLTEVLGTRVDLPRVTDESVAQLWDDDAPKTRSDAVLVAKPATAKPSTGKSGAPIAKVTALSPVVAKAVAPAAPAVRKDPEVKARAEAAAQRAVERNAERMAWEDRPLERVARKGDAGPLDPEASSAHRQAAKLAARASAPAVKADVDAHQPAVRAVAPAVVKSAVARPAAPATPVQPAAHAAAAKPAVAKPAVAVAKPAVAKPAVAAAKPAVAAAKPAVAVAKPAVAVAKPTAPAAKTQAPAAKPAQ
jgi:serine/threonine protein kinase